MTAWQEGCEVIDWPGLVADVRPTPDHTWERAWDDAEELGADLGLLDWCTELVSRSGVQYQPIVTRGGIVIEGLEQALAFYRYGSKRSGWGLSAMKRGGGLADR